MKKLVLIVVIGAFTACNENSKSSETIIDSTANTISDSLKSKSDSLSKKIDSSYQAKPGEAAVKAGLAR